MPLLMCGVIRCNANDYLQIYFANIQKLHRHYTNWSVVLLANRGIRWTRHKPNSKRTTRMFDPLPIFPREARPHRQASMAS